MGIDLYSLSWNFQGAYINIHRKRLLLLQKCSQVTCPQRFDLFQKWCADMKMQILRSLLNVINLLLILHFVIYDIKIIYVYRFPLPVSFRVFIYLLPTTHWRNTAVEHPLTNIADKYNIFSVSIRPRFYIQFPPKWFPFSAVLWNELQECLTRCK